MASGHGFSRRARGRLPAGSGRGRCGKAKARGPAHRAQELPQVSSTRGIHMSGSLPPEIERIEVAGGYLNFFLRRSLLAKEVLTEIARKPGRR